MYLRRFAQAGFLAVACPCWLAAANQFVQHPLVSDLPGVADRVDPALVNPWGIVASPTSPFWLSDNGSGLSTLYNGSGGPVALKVAIPAPGGKPGGAATGVIFNGTSSFNVAPGKPASFIFATEDGAIAGWNSQVDQTHAVILVDRSASGAVYKGLAMATRSEGPLLYAANFNSGTISVFDGNLNPVNLPGAFQDSSIPAGFAPFNIQNLGGTLYVTYAKQNAQKHDDVAGAGNGYVDAYDLNGLLLQRLVAGGSLNSPWGLALAPASFGDFGGALLVGNFGSGAINAYDPATGNLLGQLQDVKGNVISIPGLWGLSFGNGSGSGDTNTLYFAAGIPGPADPIQSHGLFGAIQAAPAIGSNGVFNAASYQPGMAPGGFASIQGLNLSITTRSWGANDFVNGALPTQLDNVSVTVDGKPAYVYFVSPRQINFIAPADSTQGSVPVIVTNNGFRSAAVNAQLQEFSPGFFVIQNGKYIVATHADGSLVGPASLLPSLTTPARPGETITLYGTGFGPTNPATDGQVLPAPVRAATQPAVSIGGVAASVTFAGLTSAGLYQVNMQVPATLSGGDAPVIAQAGTGKSQANVFIAVEQQQLGSEP
jgi:uncharacterized protein (TIGR03118 family)